MPNTKRATPAARSAKRKSVQPKPNPAPFNDDVLKVIGRQLRRYNKLLDPFAGTGKGVDYMAALGHKAVGVELEPEWAAHSDRVEVGNALSLRWRANTFDAVFTSPTYGNRMADHHNAQEVCSKCGGRGTLISGDTKGGKLNVHHEATCPYCGGKGRRTYKRHTYKHYLERDPSPDSSAVMQWGEEYREFHRRAWKEVDRVVKRRIVLNVSDHYRKGNLMPVTEFHIATIKALGWKLTRHIEVVTQRMRHGENYEIRAEYESVLVFDRKAM